MRNMCPISDDNANVECRAVKEPRRRQKTAQTGRARAVAAMQAGRKRWLEERRKLPVDPIVEAQRREHRLKQRRLRAQKRERRLDNRVVAAKRTKELVAEFENALLAEHGSITTDQRIAVERAAAFVIIAEDAKARVLAGDPTISLRDLVRVENTATRAVRQLGIKPGTPAQDAGARPRTLREYLAQRSHQAGVP
jgi:hypothetical protein